MSISKDRRKLNAILALSSRKIVPIPGDGNCLFRALALAIKHGEEDHLAVREEVVHYLELHRAEFELYPDTADEWPTFIQRTRTPGYYAGEPCILGAAMLYRITILIHATALPTQRYVGGNDDVVELAYLGQSHYDLIRPISDRIEDQRTAADAQQADLASSMERLSLKTIGAFVASSSHEEVEDKSFVSLVALSKKELLNEASTLEWLRKEDVIARSSTCQHCNIACSYIPGYKEHRLGLFRCPRCHKCQSPVANTIFEGTKLSFDTFMTIHGPSLPFLLTLTDGAPFTVATVSFISILCLNKHIIYKPTAACYFLTNSLINLISGSSFRLMD